MLCLRQILVGPIQHLQQAGCTILPEGMPLGKAHCLMAYMAVTSDSFLST